MYGRAISQRINTISEQLLQVNQGSLYPALHRLEGDGLLSGNWGMSETARRVRFYPLTRAGRVRLARETRSWSEYSRAIQLILGTKA